MLTVCHFIMDDVVTDVVVLIHTYSLLIFFFRAVQGVTFVKGGARMLRTFKQDLA